MKANAPEKIYLPYKDGKVIGLVKETGVPFKSGVDGNIEYTRTDAFIEKACSWLENNLQGIVGGSIYIEDFRKYMEGE